MTIPPEEKWEMHVLNAARAFPYPPTPDIAGTTRTALRPTPKMRRAYLRVAAVIALIVLASILFVPEIRAGVLEFLRIGAVRIFFASSETATHMPDATSRQGAEIDNATLERAEQLLGVAIGLPSYPSDLGLPDSISIVGDEVPVVTFVWRRGAGDARLVLQMIGHGIDVYKHGLRDSLRVEVNGEYAVWLDEPHPIAMYAPSGRAIPGMSWLIQSHVLVWAEGDITYRLETAEPLSEALQIAESIQPAGGD